MKTFDTYDMKRTWNWPRTETRYYVNGVRVSESRYRDIDARARMHGSQDCFSGKAVNRYGRSESTYCARC